MQHRFEASGGNGSYQFLYDQSRRIVFLVQWPNGRPTEIVLAAGLLKTIEDAIIAAKLHIGYIENGFPNC